MKKPAIVLGASLFISLAVGCSDGDDPGSSTFGTFGGSTFGTTTGTTGGDDIDSTDEGMTTDTTTGTDTTTTGTDTTTTGTDTTTGTTTTTTDTTSTTGGAQCGNGVIDPGETCDGNNFGGVTCVDLGYDGGSLTCNNCIVSTNGCTNAPQPGLGQLYSTCLDSSSCPGLDGCVTVTMQGDVDPYAGFCTNVCTSDAECFANVGGSAVPQCNDENPKYCELDCAGGKTCPGGMECTPLVGGKEICF